jgi:hypothetical protein
MATDEGEVKNGAPEHENAPGGAPSAGSTPPAAVDDPAAAEPRHPDASGSEWTASDARGPLAEPPPLSSVPPHQDYDATGFDREPEVSPDGGDAREHAPHAGAPGPSPVQEVKPAPKPSRWPIAAGILLGAVLGAAAGAGSAYYVNTMTPSGDPAMKLDIDSLKTTLAGLDARVDANGAALKQAAQVLSRNGTGGGTAALDGKVAALQAAVDTLQSQSQKAAAVSDLKALQDRVAAIDSRVPELQKQVSDLRSVVSAALAGVDDLRAGQKSLEGKITNAPAFAVLADSLGERINRGQPFAAEVTALETLGVDSAKIAVLRPFARQGVASVKTLADQFADVAGGVIAAAHKLPADASYWVRLKEEAGRLVSIRRTGETGGDDLESRIAEIRADLARGDVIAADKAWELLPADVKMKPEAVAWGKLATAHAEASAAAHAIENDAIVSLGAKKS